MKRDDKPAPEPRSRSDAQLGIVDALAQLSFVVQGALGRIAAEHDLSIVQTRLLGVLRDRSPGMNELARHLGARRSRASPVSSTGRNGAGSFVAWRRLRTEAASTSASRRRAERFVRRAEAAVRGADSLSRRASDGRRARRPIRLGKPRRSRGCEKPWNRAHARPPRAGRVESTDPMQNRAASFLSVSLGLVACGASHSSGGSSNEGGDGFAQGQEAGEGPAEVSTPMDSAMSDHTMQDVTEEPATVADSSLDAASSPEAAIADSPLDAPSSTTGTFVAVGYGGRRIRFDRRWQDVD